MIYFLVDFIVYSIIGAFLTLGLLFAFTKAPFGKRFDKLTTIAASHDKRMGKINKKYSLLNSKMRRRVFLNQFVSFVLIVLPIILAFYFATQGIDFSWNLAKQFGIAIDSVPLFPRTY
ncbi:MAG: hypothetical protein F4160_12380 [Rhodospirillaceae bacterium]|nr:hypothetical protein [Rhodospirillaceae bacterium]